MKKQIVNIIKIICFALVLFFLVRMIWSNINDLKKIHFRPDIPVLILSLAVYFIYKLYNALLWHVLTVKTGCSIKLDNSLIAWSYSQLGKFIPGKVFYLLGRLYYYKKEEVPAAKVTFCFLLENAYTFLSALFMLVFSMPFVKMDILDQYKYFSIIILVLFFICINPRFMEKCISFVLKIFGKASFKLQLTYRDTAFLLVLFITNWLVMGIGFFILSRSLYPLEADKFFYMTAAFALSNVIGILSFFAPAGIGVRETILIFTLQIIMPSSYAVIISIVSRIWATAGELSIVFAAFAYENIVKLINKAAGCSKA